MTEEMFFQGEKKIWNDITTVITIIYFLLNTGHMPDTSLGSLYTLSHRTLITIQSSEREKNFHLIGQYIEALKRLKILPKAAFVVK